MTFTLPKFGHLEGQGGYYTGELKTADIGIPEDVVEQVLAEKDDEGRLRSLKPAMGPAPEGFFPGAVQMAIREPSEGCSLWAEA